MWSNSKHVYKEFSPTELAGICFLADMLQIAASESLPLRIHMHSPQSVLQRSVNSLIMLIV